MQDFVQKIEEHVISIEPYYLPQGDELAIALQAHVADDRRELPVKKLGLLFTAAPGFMLAVSYNPGYQSVLKNLKQSTRQRFLAIEFSYPAPEIEARIVSHESGVELDTAKSLVRLAAMTRGLKDSGLQEGASTRLLIHAAKLITAGLDSRLACRAAITQAVADDHELLAAIDEMVSSIF